MPNVDRITQKTDEFFPNSLVFYAINSEKWINSELGRYSLSPFKATRLLPIIRIHSCLVSVPSPNPNHDKKWMFYKARDKTFHFFISTVDTDSFEFNSI